ncbi:hypothetical protein [Legionella tucsonensis]|uniref:Uncharacterized protein n=1 Tax=Legionella tucsonensis TaxID=40335 RepID=A0A0W0ZYW9_9GAMM|nr:hypothetical protein [Legionella tucsonensis]KTD74303.1 hypothetical protein Ltuc_2150 [Legionella tucsonensis]
MPDLQPVREVAQDDLQALIEKNPCSRCRAAKFPVCKCKGPGGSGGGGSSSEERLEIQVVAPMQNIMSMQKQDIVDSVPLDLYADDGLLTVHDSLSIDLFELEEMTEFLLFSHDSKRGVITIRPNPSLLLDEKEMRELIQTLKKAFEQFKIALEKEGVPVDDFTITLNKNELIVRDTFIKELVSRNLLPKAYAPNLKLENQPTRLTPFTTTPKPSLRSRDEKEKEEKYVEEKETRHESEEKNDFNPSPFSFSLSLSKLFGGRS